MVQLRSRCSYVAQCISEAKKQANCSTAIIHVVSQLSYKVLKPLKRVDKDSLKLDANHDAWPGHNTVQRTESYHAHNSLYDTLRVKLTGMQRGQLGPLQQAVLNDTKSTHVHTNYTRHRPQL